MSQYDIGDKVRLTATFKNLNNIEADPTAVTLKVRDPSGTETSYAYPVAVTRSGLGVYYHDLTFDKSGNWFYRWVGTGDVHTAAEARLRVKDTAFDAP